MRKNFTLKTRGVLCCCTGVEIILPVFFLAVLCLPKALVKDERNNDFVPMPYQLSTDWGTTGECMPGYKVAVVPNSAEAVAVARQTVLRLGCDAARSTFPDVPGLLDGGNQWFRRQAYCNQEAMGHYDPDLASALTAGPSGPHANKTTLSQLGTLPPKVSYAGLCSDECLRNATCYADAWGNFVLPSMTQSFATKEQALEWVEANPGRTLALVAFESGIAGSTDPTSETIKYSLGTNTSGFTSSKYDAEFTKEFFTNQWESEAAGGGWRNVANFVRIQNAVDGALIDEKDGGLDHGVTLDVSVKPYPWRGYDYNIGGIIAAGVFAILGALAFMSNVVITMKSIVMEKELRLREGMQMMGMSSNMYWLSWFFTHWSTAMVTVVLLCIVGVYPFEYTNPVMQLIFYTLWITSCILWNYMISTFFSKSITASVVGCFVYVISIAPAIAVRIVDQDGGASWLATCLLPGSSINMWGSLLSTLELAKEGITFTTASQDVNKIGSFSAWGIIGMVFFDCVLYALITWYLDKVWPTEYGQRLEPWFMFTRAYWIGNKSDDGDSSVDSVEAGDKFEPLPPELVAKASVKIRNLRKTFNNGVTAVDDLSVTFVPGQVSALLGHNGAGKTTTISILTGMLNQTSGEALINGKSISTEMSAIRQSLGICPQFDVLWPTMTVKEHLKLYAAFAGMPNAMINQEVEAAVTEVALSEKLNYPTGKLSGGQKRKLSLAISFIGRPDVVFLDEPTSGMDPYSRRFTWEVIRKRAARSSILLTTHFLDEADLLCDRVAIMSAGKLACVGSPLFLKNRYGAGYHLTFARSANNDGAGADNMLEIVRKHLPTATVASDVGAELSFLLPYDGTGKFATLFEELDGCLNRLGFDSYGISCTTLEEVFLSIARGGVGGLSTVDSITRRVSLDGEAAGAAKKPLMDDDNDDIGEELRAEYVVGMSLLARQARGLLWKRYLNWRRDAWSIVIQIIVPVLFFVLALFMATLEFGDDFTFHNIHIDRRLLGYKPTIVSARTTDAEATAVASNWVEGTIVPRDYEAMLSCECNCPASGQTAVFSPEACCMYDYAAANATAVAAGMTVESYCQMTAAASRLSGDLQCVKGTNEMDVKRGVCAQASGTSFDGYLWRVQEERRICPNQDVIGCDALHVEGYDAATGRYKHTMYAHQSAYQSLPATLNSVNTAILRRRWGKPTAVISVTNEWLPEYKNYQDGDVVDRQNDSTFVTSLFVVMGAAVLTASIAVFPVHERRNNSKHLQMVSGINKIVYWVCHWLADLTQMILPIAAIMIIFAGFNIEQYRGELSGVFVLLLCFILSSIPYSHLMGFYFENEFYAFVGQVGAKMFLGVIATSAGMVVESIKNLNDDTKIAYDVLRVVLPVIVPHYSLGKGLYDLGQNRLNANRLRFNRETMSLVPIGAKDWSSTDVIGDEIAFLLCLGLFFAVTVLVIELSEGYILTFFARLLTSSQTSQSDDDDEDDEDEDVVTERARVQALAADGFVAERRDAMDNQDTRDGVILSGISKTFGVGVNAKKAVKNLSVGMARGQCFGLLGINGAGKTSTFRMITGEFAPSSGDTHVLFSSAGKRKYLSVHEDLSRARATMGYCPQFDGLQPNMTGREHLQFYAQVRGMPDNQIDTTVEALLTKMSLTKYADRQAGTYSGGNKRKLSVAIALVGEPAVVLLDEPSTGMDPEARRFMWDVISASTQGRTIVLTSHSMEECEALCNRIGIMVSGKFSCLGSLQHLKNRFSEGYSIDLRFEPGRRDAVFDAIIARGIPAEIVEKHDTELKLRVQDPTVKLRDIFSAIEHLRSKSGGTAALTVSAVDDSALPAASGGLIDDYSVSQTTLEQVFVRFAAKQSEETHDAPGLGGGGGDGSQTSLKPMGTFTPGVPVATAVAPPQGSVLVPVGADKALDVILPVGVWPGGPAQVQVPSFGFGSASGSVVRFDTPPGALPGQTVQIVVSNSN